MKAARRSTAFVSGLLLYCFAAGAAMKYASIGLPRHVYASLGGRNSLPVMLGEAIAIALVLAVIAAIWSYLTLRPSRRRHRPYVAWLLSGIAVAWTGWLIFGAFNFALQPRAYSAPLQSVLLSPVAPPLFGALNIFGILAGALAAGALAKRKQRSLPSTRSRRRTQAVARDTGADSTLSTLAPQTVAPPVAR